MESVRSPSSMSGIIRYPNADRDFLEVLGERIEAVLAEKGTLVDGLTEDDCANLVRFAAESEDPLGGCSPTPIQPGSNAYFDVDRDGDVIAAKLLQGAEFEDGGGRGRPMETFGTGASLMNAVAAAAFGESCEGFTGAKVLALPLRAAMSRTAVLDMARFLSFDGWGREFYHFLEAYDPVVYDKARALGVPLEPTFPVETARVLFLLFVQSVTGELSKCQQACFPVLAQTLCLNVRCFHPGATLSPTVGGTWSRRMFTPMGVNQEDVETVYVSMSVMGWPHLFESLQGFAETTRTLFPPESDGSWRPGAIYRHAFPEFNHFVVLLPPKEAIIPEHQDEEGREQRAAEDSREVESEKEQRLFSVLQLQGESAMDAPLPLSYHPTSTRRALREKAILRDERRKACWAVSATVERAREMRTRLKAKRSRVAKAVQLEAVRATTVSAATGGSLLQHRGGHEAGDSRVGPSIEYARSCTLENMRARASRARARRKIFREHAYRWAACVRTLQQKETAAIEEVLQSVAKLGKIHKKCNAQKAATVSMTLNDATSYARRMDQRWGGRRRRAEREVARKTEIHQRAQEELAHGVATAREAARLQALE